MSSQAPPATLKQSREKTAPHGYPSKSVTPQSVDITLDCAQENPWNMCYLWICCLRMSVCSLPFQLPWRYPLFQPQGHTQDHKSKQQGWFQVPLYLESLADFNDIANTWGIHLKQRKSRKHSWNPWRNVWSNSRICKHHQAIHNQSVCNCIWEPRNHQNLPQPTSDGFSQIISTYISTESCAMGMM